MSRFSAAAVAAAALAGAHAQPAAPPRLVREFNFVPTDQSSSKPTSFTAVGDRVVFTALGAGATSDLWGSDGDTSELLIAAIDNSTGDSFIPMIRSFQAPQGPRLLVTRLMSSPTGGLAMELWITDGTVAGTSRLAPSMPTGFAGSITYSEMTDVGGGLALLQASISGLGLELWRTDGTAAGTGLVMDITPGPFGTSFGSFTRAGTKIYFSPAQSNLSDRELWVTDGAIASTNTRVVRDIQPDSTPSNPIVLGTAGNLCLFTADGPGTGVELWRTDGTLAGTVFVKDINPGPAGGFPFLIANIGSRLVFSASDPTRGNEPWVSDGTAAGTVPLADVNPGPPDGSISRLVQSGNLAYFTGSSPATGAELWRTDGTPAGTRMLGELSTAPNSDSVFFGQNKTLADGRVIFDVFRRVGGVGVRSLVGTDPQGLAATVISDFPDHEISLAYQPMVNGRELFFARPLFFGATTAQLWSTDLTPGSARQEWVVPVPSFSSTCAYAMRVIVGTGGPGTDRAIFPTELSGSATLGTRRLFITDGTAAGSSELFPAAGPDPVKMDSDGAYPTVAGNKVYFAAADSRGIEPWVSLGRADATTHQLVNIRPDSTRGSSIGNTLAVGSRVLFSAIAEGFFGNRPLYSTDGTPEGTVQLAASMDTSGVPARLPGNRAVVSTDSGLLVTDGTSAGTGPLLPGGPDFPSTTGNVVIAVSGGRVVFSADDPLNRSDLWVSDGTAANTHPIGEFRPVGDVSALYNLTAVSGGRACFVFGAFGSSAIYSTDGTTITQHSNMPGGPVTARPGNFVPIGDRIALIDRDAMHGEEVRVLDLSGGSLVALNIAAGPSSGFPTMYGEFGGWLVFSASDATGLRSAYISDGTVAGTFAVDGDPGPDRSDWTPQRWWNGRIIFTGYQPSVGTECFAVDPVSRAITLLGETSIGANDFSATPFTPIAEVSGGLLGLGGNAATGAELWFSDGTTAGTRLLADVNIGADGSQPVVIAQTPAGRVYLTADAGAAGGGPGVYAVEGTTVTRVISSPVLAGTPVVWVNGGRTIFAGFNPHRGNELWSWQTPGLGCRADFNGDGSTGVQDIFDFLAAYFTGDSRADVNDSGLVSIQDVFDFLVAYFGGCP